MYISDEELNERLNDPRNLVNRNDNSDTIHNGVDRDRRENNDLASRKDERVEIIKDTALIPLHNGGRRPGDKNIPEFMQNLIGISANMDTIKNTAEAFDVSPHHVHELKHAKKSNAQGQDENLMASINKGLIVPHNKAIDRLMVALELSDESIEELETKDRVTVASQLASIADKTKPVLKENDANSNVQLNIYAPQVSEDNTYNSIEVSQ